jgi:hypothetical protein
VSYGQGNGSREEQDKGGGPGETGGLEGNRVVTVSMGLLWREAHDRVFIEGVV